MANDRSHNLGWFSERGVGAPARGPRLALALLASAASLAILFVLFPAQPIRYTSRWPGPAALAAVVAEAAPVAPADLPATPIAIAAEAAALADPLEEYNRGSALQDADPQQRVRFYRRDLPGGGALAYFVVALDEQVRLAVVGADGATPASDAGGDTIWSDGQRHLASVAAIARAPYAAREGFELLGAMAFGFHGDERTSDEGTVVVDGQVLRVNPGRAAVCIAKDGRARVGLFDAAALRDCQQAAGAGPVILWKGKIANPDVAAENDRFVPYNPLGEDFVQIDWRRMIYSGRYPKTAVGVGTRPDGGAFVVMTVSYGVTGVDLAGQLKAMGCSDALGGDDDTSTQAVWRGEPVQSGPVQNVPDALVVYVRR